MEVVFADSKLDRLETDAAYTAGLPAPIVSKYRQRMQQIRAAEDERDLRNSKSLHFEKLQGNRSHQHSIRLNKQWRLILELRGDGTSKVVAIVSVEDYH